MRVVRILLALLVLIVVVRPAVAGKPKPAAVTKPAAATKPPAPVPGSADNVVRNVWMAIGELPNSCADFDYFPGGGMLIFACHAWSAAPYPQLSRLAGMPVFVQGPHTDTELKLYEQNDFGHYNPEFVRWMTAHFIPGAKDEVFRKSTQGIYDKTMRERATLFFATYHKAKEEPTCWSQEVERYRSLVAADQLPYYDYERYFYFMNDGFCGHADEGFSYFYEHGFAQGYDGNVVKSCAAFWIRREIDGTADEFYEGLETLVRTYDPELYRRYQ